MERGKVKMFNLTLPAFHVRDVADPTGPAWGCEGVTAKVPQGMEMQLSVQNVTWDDDIAVASGGITFTCAASLNPFTIDGSESGQIVVAESTSSLSPDEVADTSATVTFSTVGTHDVTCTASGSTLTGVGRTTSFKVQASAAASDIWVLPIARMGIGRHMLHCTVICCTSFGVDYSVGY